MWKMATIETAVTSTRTPQTPTGIVDDITDKRRTRAVSHVSDVKEASRTSPGEVNRLYCAMMFPETII